MENSLTHRFKGRLFVETNEYENKRKKLESGFISNDKYLSFLSESKLDSSFMGNLISICAAAIIIDGEHQEIEKKMINELCTEFKVEVNSFNSKLENEISNIKNLNYNSIISHLKNVIEINEANNSLLFESAMHIILSDGIMTMSECNLLADIGNLLEIPTAQILARLSLFLRKEEQILVDVEESINWNALTGLGE